MARPVYREVRRAITERDSKVLEFLWRWKVVSSQALARKFFPTVQPQSAHLRLRQLEEVGYLVSHSVSKREYAWGIGKKGYEYIKDWFNVEVHDGYKTSYPHHDFLATAFHLGEWLTKMPDGAEVYSELELRCVVDELYPDWIPQSTMHRPDGYSKMMLNDRQMISAFEVELTLKSKRRYEALVYFYDNQPTINHVYWLVGSRGMAKSIERIFARYNSREFSKHSFILLEHFLKSGWDAPAFHGSRVGKSLNEILRPYGIPKSSPWHHLSDISSFLDTKVCPTKPTPCDSAQDALISDIPISE